MFKMLKITNSSKYSLLFLFLFIFICLTNLAISTPTGLLNSKKLSKKQSESMEDLEILKKRIFENEENSILVFYADWCGHW
jgi:thiol:disulfide interchange protein